MPGSNLTEFIEQVTGDSHLRVEDDLGDGFVVLRVSEAERRQARHDVRSTEDIVIEMLRNARDAHAKNIFLACAREGSMRTLVMLDDGDGVPEHLYKRIFDARVTSKLDTMHIDAWGVHGRGMALYSIRLNSKKALVAASKVGGGSSFLIETDTTELPEKTDQSSLPQFIVNEKGVTVVRGTRNINRAVGEFAYVNKDNCSVYVGSPVEVAATLWSFGNLLLPAHARTFCNDPSDIDVCKRLALASDPAHFVELAESLGLTLSERSARRILDGQVDPLRPFSEIIDLHSQSVGKERKSKPHNATGIKDERGLKLSKEDSDRIKESVKSLFSDLAERYYLESDVEVDLRVRKGSLHITIPIEKLR